MTFMKVEASCEVFLNSMNFNLRGQWTKHTLRDWRATDNTSHATAAPAPPPSCEPYLRGKP